MSWAPLRYAVARPFRKPADVRVIADVCWEVSPAVDDVRTAANYAPEELDLVAGFGSYSSLEVELARIKGHRVTHAPTRLYRLKNAWLRGAYVYAGSSREQVSMAKISRPALGAPRRLPSAMMCGSVVASVYFGHFVTEQLSAELLASELGLAACSSGRQVAYAHERPLRAALGVDGSRLEHAVFDELFVIDDFGQNASKRARYCRMRELVRRGARPKSVRGVVIRRGLSGSRRNLLNEDALIESLVRDGFAVVDPARDGILTLRDALHDAPVVVGVEGSSLV
ncbi:MAG: glycosyltransferase family 61 protein, partial [Polyangiaceae bacterium]|nr:glycosyltransferase family 61 protein [Polyangiaceae bacterium]